MKNFHPVSRKTPCPRCGHGTWCLLSRDGAAVLCMRDLTGFDGHTRELGSGEPYGFHWTGEGPRPFTPPSAPSGPLPASPDARDVAYRALLAALTLSTEHRQHLRARGLSPDQLDVLVEAGYRTLPGEVERRAAVAAAVEAFPGGDASTVPGLWRGRSGWRLVGRDGLLIPVRDAQGRVVALKLRPDDPGDGGKYVWVSASGHGGASPGAPCHVAHVVEGAPLRVVEGVLKADVVAALDPSASVVGIPSCTAISTALGAMTALAPTRVLLGWDADARVNPHVARGLERAVTVVRETLPEASLAVETWPAEHKGLDDALAAQADTEAREDVDALVREILRDADGAAKAAKVDKASAPLGQQDHRALSDLGNAERLADMHRDRLRWVDGLDWLVWDGKRWQRDTSYAAQRLAVEAIRGIVREIPTHPAGAAAVTKHALRSEGANAIAAALKLLRGLPGIAHPIGDFDRDPWLLNCENGTLDLRTGALRAHDPADLITKLAPVEWDAGAVAPDFDAFLARVQPDPSTRAYVQRLMGYAATGVVREHVFPIWYGSGRNGKGTLTDAVRAALGDYATDIPAEMLTVRKNDAHPTERMCLLGARFASASETESNTALAVAFVKRATGGDAITARHMGKDFVTFEPTHKIVLSTNNRPRIRENSDAIWRRVHLVPWEVQIPEGEVDAGLRDRLREEHRAAVLRWIVDGCLAWQREGLAAPEKVVAATRAYREDSEPDVLAFLRERCVVAARTRVARGDFLRAFNAWAIEDGGEPVAAKTLGDYISEHGAALGITRASYGGVKVYAGLRLKTDAELAADAAEARDADRERSDGPDRSGPENIGPIDRAHASGASNHRGFGVYGPDGPDDMHSHTHSAHAHTRAPDPIPYGPDCKVSGPSGPSGDYPSDSSRLSMGPIFGPDRAHRAHDSDVWEEGRE